MCDNNGNKTPLQGKEVMERRYENPNETKPKKKKREKRKKWRDKIVKL